MGNGVQFHEGETFTENPLRRFLGLEIEICGAYTSVNGWTPSRFMDRILMTWNGTREGDASLPVGGFELRTAPACGDAFVRQVQEIAWGLEQIEAWTDHRAGLHCHVDCRDFDWKALRRLVGLYVRLEPALFALVPEQRRASTYTAPCAARLQQAFADLDSLGINSIDDREEIEAALLDAAIYSPGGTPIVNVVQAREVRRALARYKGARGCSTRYSALNVHSYFYRGTVECRLFPGTTDPNKMLGWAMLLGSIVEHALQDTSGSLVKGVRPRTPLEGGRHLLELAPTPGVRDWIKERWQAINGTAL